MQAIKEYWEKSTPMKFDVEEWSYEKKRKFRYDLQDYMHSTFRFREWKDKRVLEIGCGAGIDALEFALNGAEVVATDITDSALLLTQKLAKEVGTKLETRKITDSSLPFDNMEFDCVYSFGVLHHIPNVEQMLSEIQRVLKPGGTVLAMVYNKNSLLNAYSILFLHRDEALSEKQLSSKYSERNIGCPYTKLYTVDEVRSLFSWYFKKLLVTTHYNVIDLPQQRKVKLSMPTEFNDLGWHIVVRGQNG